MAGSDHVKQGPPSKQSYGRPGPGSHSAEFIQQASREMATPWKHDRSPFVSQVRLKGHQFWRARALAAAGLVPADPRDDDAGGENGGY